MTLSVSFSDDKIVFLNNKTNKAEALALMDDMSDIDAINATKKEIDASVSAARGAVALLSRILNNPRLDAYAGKTPAGEKQPKEFTAACRELEVEYLRPIFLQNLKEKGNSDKAALAQWDKYIGGLRSGGSYANAASVARSYLAITGKKPVCDNGKLLTVAAMAKLIAIEKDKVAQDKPEGIAGRLVALSGQINDRKDNDMLGDCATAIAALKTMLATYEGIHREALEALTDAIGNPEHNVTSSDVTPIDLSVVADNLLAKWADGAMTMPELMDALDDSGIDYDFDDEGNNFKVIV